MRTPHALSGAANMHRLLQSIKDELRMSRGANAPTDDLAGMGVDDEGDIHEPLPGGEIGEITDSEHVRRGHAELAVPLVQRARRFLVGIVVLCGLPRIMP